MRLVHLADLHLGFRQHHRVTPSGSNQREADVGDAFHRAVDRIIAIDPDVIVVAGDVFHAVRPMNAAIIQAFQQFDRIRRALPSAVIVMVAGNHDRPRTTETGCILRLFEQLGIDVVDDEPRRLSYPERSLNVLAVPGLVDRLPSTAPDTAARHNVMVLHGMVEGILPLHMGGADRAPLEIPRRAVTREGWSYVALGHYHVHRQLGPRSFYSGSLEYTSANPWGELAEERELGLPGKGFVEFDLEGGTRVFHHVPPSRPLLDLEPIAARGLSAAEVDVAIRDRVERCEGGIDDRIVRLVVRDVPRHIARELDHRALREFRRRATHFQLDTRRPEIIRRPASGAPGRRPTLTDMVESYLSKRQLESDIERPALVSLGLRYLAEASAAEQSAPVSD